MSDYVLKSNLSLQANFLILYLKEQWQDKNRGAEYSVVHWKKKGGMEVGLEHIKEKSKTFRKQQ